MKHDLIGQFLNRMVRHETQVDVMFCVRFRATATYCRRQRHLIA